MVVMLRNAEVGQEGAAIDEQPTHVAADRVNMRPAPLEREADQSLGPSGVPGGQLLLGGPSAQSALDDAGDKFGRTRLPVQRPRWWSGP